MSTSEFQQFLTVTLSSMAKRCRDGAIAFVCMDWRHMGEVLKAGEAAFDEVKNFSFGTQPMAAWMLSTNPSHNVIAHGQKDVKTRPDEKASA